MNNHEHRDDPIPWQILELAYETGPWWLRDLLTALADAWEVLPDGWRDYVLESLETASISVSLTPCRRTS